MPYLELMAYSEASIAWYSMSLESYMMSLLLTFKVTPTAGNDSIRV